MHPIVGLAFFGLLLCTANALDLGLQCIICGWADTTDPEIRNPIKHLDSCKDNPPKNVNSHVMGESYCVEMAAKHKGIKYIYRAPLEDTWNGTLDGKCDFGEGVGNRFPFAGARTHVKACYCKTETCNSNVIEPSDSELPPTEGPSTKEMMSTPSGSNICVFSPHLVGVVVLTSAIATVSY